MIWLQTSSSQTYTGSTLQKHGKKNTSIIVRCMRLVFTCCPNEKAYGWSSNHNKTKQPVINIRIILRRFTWQCCPSLQSNTTLIHKNPLTGLLRMKYLQGHLVCPITYTSLEGYEAGYKHVHTNLKYSQERLGQISLKDVKSISIGIINIWRINYLTYCSANSEEVHEDCNPYQFNSHDNITIWSIRSWELQNCIAPSK
jgi:hypothetical protein